MYEHFLRRKDRGGAGLVPAGWGQMSHTPTLGVHDTPYVHESARGGHGHCLQGEVLPQLDAKGVHIAHGAVAPRDDRRGGRS